MSFIKIKNKEYKQLYIHIYISQRRPSTSASTETTIKKINYKRKKETTDRSLNMYTTVC